HPLATLLWPIADIAASRAGALSIIAGSAGFRTQAAGHSFGHITRARMLRPIVARTAYHRFVLLVRLAVVVALVRHRRRRGIRIDIAENAVSSFVEVVLGHRYPPNELVASEMPSFEDGAHG